MSDRKDNLAAKKAAILEKEKRKNSPIIILAAVIVLTAAGGLMYFYKSPAPSVSAKSENDSAHILYPLKMFDDGQAQYFEYKEGSTTIRYFVLKSSDGVIRAAFDACDVCWPSGKGYYQDGNDMICANCGKHFSSVLINDVRGGCNPEPLSRAISGDNLVIRTEDILKGKKYFDF